jgi:hypothetical protein
VRQPRHGTSSTQRVYCTTWLLSVAMLFLMPISDHQGVPNLPDPGVVEIVASALHAWTATLGGYFIYRRENEFISDFVFTTLIHRLDDPRRICIESAVPQIQGDRRKAQVRKDLVIWAKPRQTCFDVMGRPTCFPDLVVEWKGRTSELHDGDVDWLQSFTATSPCHNGLAVSVENTAAETAVCFRRVHRGLAGAVELILPRNGQRS